EPAAERAEPRAGRRVERTAASAGTLMGTIERAPRPAPASARLRVDGLVALGAGILAALLPREPRERLARRHGVDPAFWSPLVGLVELFAGGWTLVGDFLVRIRGLVDQGTDAALQGGFEYGDVSPLTVMWGGAFAWLRWLTSRWTLFLLQATITGGVRLVSFAITREPVGEPLAWLGFWLWRLGVQKPAAATHDALHFGPARADRVLPQEDGGLLVL